MNLHIARWGNSLALRIPADYARRTGIKEGDSVEASLTADGGITIRPTRWDRKTFARELAQTRSAIPMGTSVMDELRRGARY
jgi:antitoxin MazE